MDLSKYKSLFITESREHLDEMTNNLLVLERHPSDKTSMDDIFRHAHSIKGMAASMGYDKIQVLSHVMEDVMDVFRKGFADITTEAVDELLAARDRINAMVDEVEKSEEPAFLGGEDAINRLNAWKKQNLPDIDKQTLINADFKKTTPEPEPPSSSEDDDFGGFDGEVVSADEAGPTAPAMPDWPDDHMKSQPAAKSGWYIHIDFEGETEAPAARAFLAIKRIESLGDLKSSPTLDEIKSGKFAGVLKAELQTGESMEKIRSVLDGLTGVATYRMEPLGETDSAQAYVVQGRQPVEFGGPEPGDQGPVELPRTVRVDTRTLDNFVNVVGELLTVRSSLRDLARPLENPELNGALDKLEGLIHELHSQVMDVRMMPLEMVTSRLPRLVRDLAKTAAKDIELKISGEDIELDRAILERLNDPLIHLLRNSVDHGIEFPEERERLRKPRTGKVRIDARREKDMIMIEVSDDGKGMDPEVLRESAIAKGLIDAATAEKLSQEEALMLVCMPGFSTSETVSFISGRGVGMDVVKSTIESLGGGMRLQSKLGEGTRTTLNLPRTVSILNVLLVNVEKSTFAVPIGKLLRTVELTRKDFQDSQKGRMVILDSVPYPVFELRELLMSTRGMNEADHMGVKPSNGIINALVVDHGLKPFAVTVDSFLGQEEAFIRPLGRPLSRIEGLAGIMTRGDGKPVFVLDIPSLRGGAQV